VTSDGGVRHYRRVWMVQGQGREHLKPTKEI